MIQIKTHGDYGIRIERLFDRLDDSALDYVDDLESQGYIVTIVNLPSHIDTHERYAAVLLDQFDSMYQLEPTKGH